MDVHGLEIWRCLPLARQLQYTRCHPYRTPSISVKITINVNVRIWMLWFASVQNCCDSWNLFGKHRNAVQITCLEFSDLFRISFLDYIPRVWQYEEWCIVLKIRLEEIYFLNICIFAWHLRTFMNSTLDSRGLSNLKSSKKFSSIGNNWASLRRKNKNIIMNTSFL